MLPWPRLPRAAGRNPNLRFVPTLAAAGGRLRAKPRGGGGGGAPSPPRLVVAARAGAVGRGDVSALEASAPARCEVCVVPAGWRRGWLLAGASRRRRGRGQGWRRREIWAGGLWSGPGVVWLGLGWPEGSRPGAAGCCPVPPTAEEGAGRGRRWGLAGLAVLVRPLFSILVGTKMSFLVCSGWRMAGFGGWEGVLQWCGGGRRHRLPVSLRPPLTTGGRCVSVLFQQVWCGTTGRLVLQGRLRARWGVCESNARRLPLPATTTSLDAINLLGGVAMTLILWPVACPWVLSATLVTSDPSELLLEAPFVEAMRQAVPGSI